MEGLGQAWGYQRAGTGGAPRRPGGWGALRDTRGARWEREGRGLPWTPAGQRIRGLFSSSRPGLPLRPQELGTRGAGDRMARVTVCITRAEMGTEAVGVDGLQGEALCAQGPGPGVATGAARQEPGGRGAWSCPRGEAEGNPIRVGGLRSGRRGDSGRAPGRGDSGWAVGGSVRAVGGGGLRPGGGVPVRSSLAGVPQRVAGEGGWQDHTAQETRAWGVLSEGPVGGAGGVPTSLSSYTTTWSLFPCVMETRPRAAKGRNEGASRPGAGPALHPTQGSTTNWPRNWESDPRLTLSTLPATAPGASAPTLGKGSRQSEGLVRGQGRGRGGRSQHTGPPQHSQVLAGSHQVPPPMRGPLGHPGGPHTWSQQGTHSPLPGVRAKGGEPFRPLSTDRQQGSWHMTPPSAIPGGTVCGLCLSYVGLRNSLSISQGQKKKTRKDSFRTGENSVKLTFQHHKV